MTFRKQERIVSKQLIETLFDKGDSQSLAAYPLRAIYTKTGRRTDCAETQILICVPKKRFKHAVDRNRVKRQVREAYRKNKHLLSGHIEEDKQLLIAFVWLSDHHCPTIEVEKRIVSLLKKIASKA